MLSCSIGILDHLSRQVSEDDAKPRASLLAAPGYGRTHDRLSSRSISSASKPASRSFSAISRSAIAALINSRGFTKVAKRAQAKRSSMSEQKRRTACVA